MSAMGVRIAYLVLVALTLVLLRVPLFSGGGGWIAFDDLIPLQYPHQVWDFLTASWNEYYQWPELRGRYSLLGTPFRYGPLIPIGLLVGGLLAGLGAFRLTLALQRWERALKSGSPAPERGAWVGPLVSGGLYLMLTLTSKAHQLHTLFLGTGLLPWTVLAFLQAVHARSSRAIWGWAALAALLLVVNPAIHLVLLGFGAMTVLAGSLLGCAERRRAALRAWAVGALGSLLYGVALLVSGPGLTTPATASVPPGLLEAWSGPLGPRLLLPLGLSLPETARAGEYVFLDDLFARYPAASRALGGLSLLAGLALVVFRRSPRVRALGIVWLGSVFLSTGVYYDLSGYRALLALAELPGWGGTPARIVLAVLRNPDRWLLLASLAWSVLIGLGIAFLVRLALREGRTRRRALRLGFAGALILGGILPLGLHPTFRPLVAGDVGGVLRPVPLPTAYREALAQVGSARTLYLPPMGARPLRWNRGKKTQDEALLLLHGGPSLEGVTGSPLLNQLYLLYAYRELLYAGRSQALGRYLALGSVRYLLFHDDVESPLWPDEFLRVREALYAQQDLRLRWEREGIALFENEALPARGAEAPVPLKAVILFEGPWAEMVALLEAGIDPRRVGLLPVGEGAIDWETLRRWSETWGSRLLVYRPPGLAEEDLWLSLWLGSEEVGAAVGYPEVGYGPQARRWWDHRWLNITAFNFVRFQERYGLFGVEGARDFRLAAAAEEDAAVEIPLRLAQAGDYILFLRAAAPWGARLRVTVDGLYSREVELPSSFPKALYYAFYEVDRLRLRAGSHRVRIRTLSNRPLVINLVAAFPAEALRAARERGRALRAQSRIRWATTPDQVLDFVADLAALPSPREGGPSLYGLYGPVYWERRALEVRGPSGTGTIESVRPRRAWGIGHLYEVPGGWRPVGWPAAPGPRDDARGADLYGGQDGRGGP